MKNISRLAGACGSIAVMQLATALAPKWKTVVNIGINRRRPGSRYKKDVEHTNLVGVVIPLPFEHPDFHKAVRDHVAKNKPGWDITGYCKKED